MGTKKTGIGILMAGALLVVPLPHVLAQSMPPDASGISPQSSSTDQPPASPPVVAPLATDRSWLDAPEITLVRFPADRREAIEDVAADPSLSAWLQHGRVMIAGGYIKEAITSWQNVVASSSLDFEQRKMATGLRMAIIAMGETPPALPEGWDVPKSRDFFSGVVEIREEAIPDPARVRSVLDALERQSQAVALQITPVIFDAARRADDAVLAADILRAAEKHGITGDPSWLRMAGDLALLEGDAQTAFGHFIGAMKVNDVHGATARVRIADMGMAKRDRESLEAVRDILREGLTQWRGDEVALIMLTRLAAVSEALSDAPLALRTMARIRMEYPDRPQAGLAAERIDLIFRHFASEMDEEQIGFEAYAAVIRDLKDSLTDYPGWAVARTSLARAYERRGLLLAAAAEYADLRGDIIHNGTPSDLAQDADILAREVQLWMDGGDRARAISLLSSHAAPLYAISPELLSTALNIIGPADRDAALKGVPVTSYRLVDQPQMARIAFLAESWPAAVASWDLWMADGNDLSKTDEVRYIFAKSAIGDQVENDQPDVDGEPQQGFLIRMNRAITEEKPDPEKLDQGTARAIVDTAAQAAEAARTEMANLPYAKNATANE